MKYDFDTVYDRHHTNCAKYDSGHTDDPDLIPMWVADMDFKTLPDIPEALSKRVLDGIYGYSTIPEEYLESVVGWNVDMIFMLKKTGLSLHRVLSLPFILQ